MKRVVVIGSNGQLGQDLMRACSEAGIDPVGLTHADIEIADSTSVDTILSEIGAEIIINTAAFHGGPSYVTADQGSFFRVNAIGVWNLARFCRRQGTTLVHFSTDYVFGRERGRQQPYVEEDSPCPVNVYGASKLAGELLVRAYCPKHYVIRVASLYGRAGCRAKGSSNFVKGILNKARKGEPLRVVNDQVMSPTWTRVVAAKTMELLDSGASYGLYHMAGRGFCSWFDFGEEILRIAGVSGDLQPSVTAEGPDDVFLRPRWTALENSRLREVGLKDLPTWNESLEAYLREEEGVA